MMFFKNYSKPGKGVKKRDPNQPRYKIYFEILPRNLWRLFKLNLLYLLTLLPFFVVTMIVMDFLSRQIVVRVISNLSIDTFIRYNFLINVILSFLFTVFLGQGPVTAGMTYVVREFGNEKPCWLISDFFERVKLNFKQGMVMWVFDLIIMCGGTVAVLFCFGLKKYMFASIMISNIMIYILAHIYIYQIMITYKLKLRHVFKNAVLIVLSKLPQSILFLMSLLFVYVVLPILVTLYGNVILFTIMVIIEIAFMPTLTAFTLNFCVYPILKKLC